MEEGRAVKEVGRQYFVDGMPLGDGDKGPKLLFVVETHGRRHGEEHGRGDHASVDSPTTRVDHLGTLT